MCLVLCVFRPGRVLGVQVRAVRAGGGGAALPVAPRPGEQGHPCQGEEGEEAAAPGDPAPGSNRQLGL